MSGFAETDRRVFHFVADGQEVFPGDVVQRAQRRSDAVEMRAPITQHAVVGRRGHDLAQAQVVGLFDWRLPDRPRRCHHVAAAAGFGADQHRGAVVEKPGVSTGSSTPGH